jgi:hypothetical protein
MTYDRYTDRSTQMSWKQRETLAAVVTSMDTNVVLTTD